MYKLITIDFNGWETMNINSDSERYIKIIYNDYVKRCLYDFPDISEIKIIKNNEIISDFINWRR